MEKTSRFITRLAKSDVDRNSHRGGLRKRARARARKGGNQLEERLFESISDILQL